MVFAGFGGQGVLTGGLAMAYIALEKGVNVTWMPSYGPEMRGGKSKCVVKFGESPEEIVPVPMMAKIDVLIAMNTLALDYAEYCADNALVLVNKDAVPDLPSLPAGLRVVMLNCTKLAYDTDNPKGSSIVMLGALVKQLGNYDKDFAERAICKMFEEKGKHIVIEKNIRAFEAGWDAA